jgi:bifunctional DNA-binding transcriptional regulator/antitoxin component of YhaV-PrlF toxin-antitoxin module
VKLSKLAHCSLTANAMANWLAIQPAASEIHRAMTAKVDERRRIVLPKPVRPGELYSIQEVAAGNFVLEKIHKPVRRAKLVRQNGLLMLDNGCRLTEQDVAEVMSEFP